MQPSGEGKLAAWLFLEGGHIIENSLEILHVFHSLGVRGMTLTHGKNTDWADSSDRHAAPRGLTALGRQHRRPDGRTWAWPSTSRTPPTQTIAHVLKAAAVPVMASHSNARKLCAVPRNLPDDLIRAIAGARRLHRRQFPPRLHQAPRLRPDRGQFQALRSGRSRSGPGTGWTIPHFLSQIEWEYFQRAVVGNDPVFMDDLIDHIVHIAAIGGIDCVGLGSDFDGIASTPDRPEERRRLSRPGGGPASTGLPRGRDPQGLRAEPEGFPAPGGDEAPAKK